jgi:hypothetical protein
MGKGKRQLMTRETASGSTREEAAARFAAAAPFFDAMAGALTIQ